MMAYISRLSILKREIEKKQNIIIICERSVWTDRNVFAKMLYDDKKIEMVNYDIYNRWFDEFVDETKIDHIIYIDTTASKCYERIKKRSRFSSKSIKRFLVDKDTHILCLHKVIRKNIVKY